eukprot:g2573.t1
MRESYTIKVFNEVTEEIRRFTVKKEDLGTFVTNKRGIGGSLYVSGALKFDKSDEPFVQSPINRVEIKSGEDLKRLVEKNESIGILYLEFQPASETRLCIPQWIFAFILLCITTTAVLGKMSLRALLYCTMFVCIRFGLRRILWPWILPKISKVTTKLYTKCKKQTLIWIRQKRRTNKSILTRRRSHQVLKATLFISVAVLAWSAANTINRDVAQMRRFSKVVTTIDRVDGKVNRSTQVVLREIGNLKERLNEFATAIDRVDGEIDRSTQLLDQVPVKLQSCYDSIESQGRELARMTEDKVEESIKKIHTDYTTTVIGHLTDRIAELEKEVHRNHTTSPSSHDSTESAKGTARDLTIVSGESAEDEDDYADIVESVLRELPPRMRGVRPEWELLNEKLRKERDCRRSNKEPSHCRSLRNEDDETKKKCEGKRCQTAVIDSVKNPHAKRIDKGGCSNDTPNGRWSGKWSNRAKRLSAYSYKLNKRLEHERLQYKLHSHGDLIGRRVRVRRAFGLGTTFLGEITDFSAVFFDIDGSVDLSNTKYTVRSDNGRVVHSIPWSKIRLPSEGWIPEAWKRAPAAKKESLSSLL